MADDISYKFAHTKDGSPVVQPSPSQRYRTRGGSGACGEGACQVDFFSFLIAHSLN
jgi:hypothetical protein